MMPDILYIIKYKKRNIKLNFEKNRLILLNMKRKISKKTKLFVQFEKFSKLNNFYNINSQ